MRDIKFRAWVERHKYMAYQGDPDLETIESFMHHFGGDRLMQFIGLKDCDDKEIYEGDIIEIDYYGDQGELRYSRMQILYNELTASFCYDDSLKSDKTSFHELSKEFCKYARVVGNIYENPDLVVTSLESYA